MEFTLLWAALTGVGLMWIGTHLWIDGLPPKPADALIGGATIGLIVGRLAAMLGQGINPVTHPLDIILVRGGVDTGFASLSAISILLWTTRQPFWVWPAGMRDAFGGLPVSALLQASPGLGPSREAQSPATRWRSTLRLPSPRRDTWSRDYRNEPSCASVLRWQRPG